METGRISSTDGNIIFIGMPGCGKSTVGVVLAKSLGYRFVDADLVIQEREGRLLSEILEQEGREGFHRAEEQALLSIRAVRTVIATGGSAIYSGRAMEYLRSTGTIIYLRLPFEQIESRLGDLEERGVSLRKGQTLRELYDERVPLYERYADTVFDAEGLDIRQTALAIRARLLAD